MKKLWALEDIALHLRPWPANLHRALSCTGWKQVAEVSPRPVLHYEAFCIFFLSTKCRVIPPEWAFSTIFKPLFEPLVAQGIFFKWLRAAPGHGSSFSTRIRGFFASVRFAQTLPEMWGGGGCQTSECMILSSCCGQQVIFFQNVDL